MNESLLSVTMVLVTIRIVAEMTMLTAIMKMTMINKRNAMILGY